MAERLMNVDFSLQTDLYTIHLLQKQWNQTLNLSDEEAQSNYNPVLARWNAQRSQNPQQFQLSELLNVKTALRERNHTSESSCRFIFDETNHVQNEFFLGEPYEDILKRGIAYREREGSQEQEREAAELKAFLKLEKIFTHEKTPIGTKVIVISPPGLVRNSPYSQNFVDIYELVLNPSSLKKEIKYTRFSSSLSYDAYEQLVKEKFDPSYFNQQKGPIDAWYLSNPIPVLDTQFKNAAEVFDHYFSRDNGAIEEEKFQELWQQYLPFVLFYLDELTKPQFDPIAIAKAWNTVLHSTEHSGLKKYQKDNNLLITRTIDYLDENLRQSILAMVSMYGTDAVRVVAGGCNKSRGIRFGAQDIIASGKEFLNNSVAQFANNDITEQEWFECPKCHYKADGPVGNSCPGCGLTKEQYAEEGGEMCA